MSRYPEGFEVGFNDAEGGWYIVHCQYKGDVLHREILTETYASEQAAKDVATSLQEAMNQTGPI